MLEEQMQNGPKIPHLEQPEMKVSLEDRIQTNERRELFDHLQREIEEIRKELFLGFPQRGVLVGLRKPTEDDPNPWVIFFDANTKPNNKVRKNCAELYLLERAEEAAESDQLQRVVAILVAAEPRHMPEDPLGLMDDVSKKKQITLTPCALCRKRMVEMAQNKPELVFFDDTEVITARSDVENLWIRKYQKVRNLHPFHGEPLPDDIQEIDDSNGTS